MDKMKESWNARKVAVAKTALVGGAIVVAYYAGKMKATDELLSKGIRVDIPFEQIIKTVEHYATK